MSSAVEGLRLAVRDRRVALDELGDAALRLDAERQRRHVEQEYVLHLAAHDAGLDGRADGDDLVRVDALVRLLAEQLGHLLLHGGHARHAADEHDVLDVGCGETGVGDHLLRRPDRPLEQLRGQLEELRAGELHVEVLRAFGDGEGRLICVVIVDRLDLRLLGRVVEPLQRHRSCERSAPWSAS